MRFLFRMTRYERGRSFEYRVIKELRDRGFYVLRSAGSKGAFDLVAFDKDRVFLIQVKKKNLTRDYIEKNKIEMTIEDYNKNKGFKDKFIKITDIKFPQFVVYLNKEYRLPTWVRL